MAATVGKVRKLAIRFFSKDETIATFQLSPRLAKIGEKLGANAIEFGVDKEKEKLFIRFNNKGVGKYILNRKKQVSSSALGAKVLYPSIKKELKHFESKTTYQFTELTSSLFCAYIKEDNDLNPNLSVEENLKTVRWLEPREYSVLNKQFISFYTHNADGLKILHTSNDLITQANKSNLTHIEFGIEKHSYSVYVRFNSECRGMSLTNTLGEYVSNIPKVNLLFNTLKNMYPNLKCRKRYELKQIDSQIYQVDITGHLNLTGEKIEHNVASVNWLKENRCIDEKPHISPKKPTLKFYKKIFGEEYTYAIRFSPTFVKILKSKGYKYMKFHIGTNEQHISLELNNEGKGIRLVNLLNKYRTAGIIAKDVYKEIVQVYPHFSLIQPYEAIEVAENKFHILLDNYFE